MKKILQTTSILLCLVLIGCGQKDVQLPVSKEEEQELIQLVESYKETFIEAINVSGFNVLEPYLITNHNFYHSVRRYVQDTQSKGVKLNLVNMEIERVYKNEFGEAFVDVKETTLTTDRQQNEKEEITHLTYVIVEYNDDKRIMSILVR